MKKTVYLLFAFLTILINHNPVKANKIMASDLTWRCVGQDSFLIKLVVYRDCNGDVLSSTPIIASCVNSGVEVCRLLIGIGAPVDITPVCNVACTKCQNPSCSFPYGINKYTMQGIIKLNGAGSCCNIKLSWEQCCRNTAITTLAKNANFYTEAIFNRCLNPCDNSPTFTNYPIGILCVGQDVTFCNGEQDIDVNSTGGVADSLSWEWAEPLEAVNSPITYTGSYLYNKPIFFWGFPTNSLPYPRGLLLDNAHGYIQFRPMKPEITILAIKVIEFRNGVKIGEVRREIQFIVVPCINNTPPKITTQNDVRLKTVYPDETVRFDFYTTDPDSADTVTISWNNRVPGAIWTHNNGPFIHPSASLSWTPSIAHVSTVPYSFTVTAKDRACPIRGSFTQVYQIVVESKPTSIISEQKITQSDFKIYPIPASNYINIVYQGLSKWDGNIELFDPNSKMIYSRTVSFNPSLSQHIPLNGFSSGTYFLKLKNNFGQFTFKVFVNK